LEILYLKPTHIKQRTYLFLRNPNQQIIKSRKRNFRIYFNLVLQLLSNVRSRNITSSVLGS